MWWAVCGLGAIVYRIPVCSKPVFVYQCFYIWQTVYLQSIGEQHRLWCWKDLGSISNHQPSILGQVTFFWASVSSAVE